MKKYKIIFWVTTSIIFLAEGVMPALTSQSQMSIDGITSLGYPVYFVGMLAFFKAVGAIVLMFPKFPKNVKEWAYAGFGIDFICAFLSIYFVVGLTSMLLIPLLAMVLLVASYISYKKVY